MQEHLTEQIGERLIEAEVDGERLPEQDVLWFFQLLLAAGQKTTANVRGSPPRQVGRIGDIGRHRADSPLSWCAMTPGDDHLSGAPLLRKASKTEACWSLAETQERGGIGGLMDP